MQIPSEAMLVIVFLLTLCHVWSWCKHHNNWDLAMVIPLCWMMLYYFLLSVNNSITIHFRESIIRPAVLSYIFINCGAMLEPELVSTWIRFSRWRKGGKTK